MNPKSLRIYNTLENYFFRNGINNDTIQFYRGSNKKNDVPIAKEKKIIESSVVTLFPCDFAMNTESGSGDFNA